MLEGPVVYPTISCLLGLFTYQFLLILIYIQSSLCNCSFPWNAHIFRFPVLKKSKLQSHSFPFLYHQTSLKKKNLIFCILFPLPILFLLRNASLNLLFQRSPDLLSWSLQLFVILCWTFCVYRLFSLGFCIILTPLTIYSFWIYFSDSFYLIFLINIYISHTSLPDFIYV